jgi:ppGpp synthetase/RelA/SpoT-type nucleotidyltranferase
MANPVIDDYIRAYLKAGDYYRRAAEECHNAIRKRLSSSGMRHVVSFRAKQKERVQAKLYQRAAGGKNYQTADDIESDMADLAGVRVTLYFPGDVPEALRIIRSLFPDKVDERTFPLSRQRRDTTRYQYRFTGYVATHLQVRLELEHLSDDAKHCAGAKVEIQVASMFMHAWAEVEHDLIYKPLRGELSEEEYSWLDQINGLAIAGDLALEQLQRRMNARIADQNRRFRNHYDLASFIHSRITKDGEPAAEPRMGRADKLLAFLGRYELDSPDRLEKFLASLTTDDDRSLVEQVVANVVELSGPGGDQRLAVWRSTDEMTDITSPYGDIRAVDDGQAAAYVIERRLVEHWATLDNAAKRIVAEKSHVEGGGIMDWLDTQLVRDVLGLNASTIDRLVASHQTLTRIQHGLWRGTNEELEEHANTVREVIRRLFKEHHEVLERGEV